MHRNNKRNIINENKINDNNHDNDNHNDNYKNNDYDGGGGISNNINNQKPSESACLRQGKWGH